MLAKQTKINYIRHCSSTPPWGLYSGRGKPRDGHSSFTQNHKICLHLYLWEEPLIKIPNNCHHPFLLKLFQFSLWSSYNEVTKLSFFQVKPNRASLLPMRVSPYSPSSRSPHIPIHWWTTAQHWRGVFIKLSTVIHRCLPTEVTYNSTPISTLGTGSLNCSFQDMLPWPTRNFICYPEVQ